MKRIKLRALAAIMLISVFAVAALAENADTIEYKNDGDFKYAVSGDKVWIITDGSVKILDEKLENELGAFEIAQKCEHVAADGDRLYIHYYEGDGQRIAVYGADGAQADTLDIDPALEVVYFDVEGERLIVMTADGDETEELYISGSIYVIDINDGSMTQVGEDEIYSAFAVNGDELAAYDEYDQTLYFFSLSTGELKSEHFLDYAGYLELTDDGSLFVTGTDTTADNGKIYYADMETDSRSLAFNADCRVAGLRAGAGYLYTRESDYRTDGVYRLFAVPAAIPESNGNVLGIGCLFNIPGDSNIEAALRLTEKDIPGIEFEFTVYDDTEKMAAAMMTGEDGCDIYFMPGWQTFNAQTVYRAGATFDLREIPAVMENYGRLIDITGLMSCDGAIVAVPWLLNPTAVEVNLALFEEYGLSVPQFDWTWEDFFELAEQTEQLREEGCDIVLVYDQYDTIPVHQYMAEGLYKGNVDLDTERFRYIMENWKRYTGSGTIVSGLESGSVYEMPENALLFVGEIGHTTLIEATNSGNGTFVMLPDGGDGGGVIVRCETVCMISRANNPDAAAVFMANCIAPEVYSDELFYENNGNLLADFEILEAVKAESAHPDNFPTTENSLLWREIMVNGVYDAEYIPPEILYDWYEAYLNGEILIDEYIFKSQERVDMYLNE